MSTIYYRIIPLVKLHSLVEKFKSLFVLAANIHQVSCIANASSRTIFLIRRRQVTQCLFVVLHSTAIIVEIIIKYTKIEVRKAVLRVCRKLATEAFSHILIFPITVIIKCRLDVVRQLLILRKSPD